MQFPPRSPAPSQYYREFTITATMFEYNLFGAVIFTADAAGAQELLTNIISIQRYCCQISLYRDNAEEYFGVGYVGFPHGCQIISILGQYCSNSS